MDTQNLYQRTFGNRLLIVPLTLLLVFWLVGLLAQKLDVNIRQAELTQFTYQLVELKSVVLLMNASNESKSDIARVQKYDSVNPMAFIQTPVVNYIGELSLDEVMGVRGKWVFDPRQNILAYQPKTMTTDDFLKALPELFLGLEKLEETEALATQKKYAHWLRFKVVGLLSKEKKSLNTAQSKVLKLALM